jgi:hypothetical protein
VGTLNEKYASPREVIASLKSAKNRKSNAKRRKIRRREKGIRGRGMCKFA